VFFRVLAAGIWHIMLLDKYRGVNEQQKARASFYRAVTKYKKSIVVIIIHYLYYVTDRFRTQNGQVNRNIFTVHPLQTTQPSAY
jgi:hypothetical protein